MDRKEPGGGGVYCVASELVYSMACNEMKI